MSDNKSYQDMIENLKITDEAEIQTSAAPECIGDTKSKATTMDKSIQIDMDYEPGEHPRRTMKYWQDIAGLRGARVQYLESDVRDLNADRIRLTDYIKYLKMRLERTEKEYRQLKADQCRCKEEARLRELYAVKDFNSIGL